MIALHRKLSLTYLNKFTSSFPDDDTVNEWAALWGESLSGLTGEQIKFGLAYSAKNHEWPPTSAEFRACCEAKPKPYAPRLAPPPAASPTKARENIARIKTMLQEGHRKPGKWWAEDILQRHDQGGSVHDTALRMAREALEEKPEKEAEVIARNQWQTPQKTPAG